MPEPTEDQLRAWFRRAAAPHDLAPLVLARLARPPARRRLRFERPARLAWAAILVLAALLGGEFWLGQSRARRRARARQDAASQLAAALALAGRDLQLARRQLHGRGE